MSCSVCRYFIVLLVLISAFLSACQTGSKVKMEVKDSPHESGTCSACHIAEPSLLSVIEKKETPGEDEILTAKAMKGDLNSVCTKCHTDRAGDHAVGVAPEMNRGDLPLDNDGNITCATTCHDIHYPARGMEGYVRLTPEELCLSCHDK